MSRLRKSEAQANAEALARRSMPFAPENRTSAGMAYDFRRRQPKDLREAVRMVRKAYQDEVPTKLHEGDALADDGTPAMTSKAEAYIFGSPTWTDAGAPPCLCRRKQRKENDPHLADCPRNPVNLHDPRNRPAIAFYLTPFRATLADMERAREPHTRRRAAMVGHVAFGMEPTEAAISEGCHPLDAKLVIYDALCSFLRRLSDVRVDTRPMEEAA